MKLRKADEHERARCPHCEAELNEVLVQEINKKFLKIKDRELYFCPHCRKVLGIGQSQ